MEDELPSKFDVIIVGTGMPECILAAALARIGKTVLHLDRNEYYGGEWGTFNLDGFLKWIEHNKSSDKSDNSSRETFSKHLQENESLVDVDKKYDIITKVKQMCFMSNSVVNNEIIKEPSLEKPVETATTAVQEKEEKTSENNLSEAGENIESENEPEKKETVDSKLDSSSDSTNESSGSLWTFEKMKKEWRRFNIDLSPKVLFSRGSLVELLISSNIARYAEFKCFTRILTYLNGKLVQVPCSRSDVFSTRDVTIVEKRMLMKLLGFCLDYEQHPDEYKGFENKTFAEFLKSRKLTSNVEHYILHAIAMVSTDTPTLEGLQATQQFLKSLGRYGNTPFLWPLYGSGELPQCFCRLCAVYGGIYYLKRSVEALITNQQNECIAVISDNKRIDCSWLILESSFSIPTFPSSQKQSKNISRGIFITNKSILSAEKEQLTLLCLPPNEELKTKVTVIEVGPSAMSCPSGLFIVHMTCQKISSAEDDLKPAADILFEPLNPEINSEADGKPNILWCVYFNREDYITDDEQESASKKVIFTSGPGIDIDFDNSVKEAKQLFKKIFPEEEFLPRAPDPEEIVIEDYPAEGTEPPDFNKELNSAEDNTDSKHKNSSENEKTQDEEKSPTENNDTAIREDHQGEGDSHQGEGDSVANE